jgi:hypothetical protein
MQPYPIAHGILYGVAKGMAEIQQSAFARFMLICCNYFSFILA